VLVDVVSGALLSSLQALMNTHKDAANAAAQSVRGHARRPAAKRLRSGWCSNNALRADLGDMEGL
jgi:hypothetical protein